MIEEPDSIVLVCVPEAKNFRPVRGSVLKTCELCRRSVWESPASYEAVVTSAMETGMPIVTAERPLQSVVIGSGAVLEEFDVLGSVLHSTGRS